VEAGQLLPVAAETNQTHGGHKNTRMWGVADFGEVFKRYIPRSELEALRAESRPLSLRRNRMIRRERTAAHRIFPGTLIRPLRGFDVICKLLIDFECVRKLINRDREIFLQLFQRSSTSIWQTNE